MVVDWKLQSMTFHENGVEHTIVGVPSLRLACISFKAMMKMIKHEGPGVLVEYSGQQLETPQHLEEVPPYFHNVLQKYVHVF